MANTAGMTTSFKAEILQAQHNLNSHTIKAALYYNTATIGPSSTVYTASGELSSANYTAGGLTVTNGTVATSGTTAYWTPTANFSWTNITMPTPVNCCLLYNTSATNKSITSHTFGDQSIVGGNFTLTMPTNDAANALIRIA